MLNLFKKKEVISYYEGELSYKEIESRLTTEQTWGTDKWYCNKCGNSFLGK